MAVKQKAREAGLSTSGLSLVCAYIIQLQAFKKQTDYRTNWKVL
jgi:hypothetical protein